MMTTELPASRPRLISIRLTAISPSPPRPLAPLMEQVTPMDMAITIRTIVTSGGVAHAQAGCGIVYDSVPSSEFEETMNKARALLTAIDQAERTQPAKEVARASAAG